MRHRLETGLTDRATIERWTEDDDDNGDDDDPFPESSATTDAGGSWETIAEDVPCSFDDESTEYVRRDDGQRVHKPATVTFQGQVDVEEDDRLAFDRVAGAFEAIGIEETVDHRRGVVVSTTVELEDR